MARLPKPGGDENTWGNVLNEFLAQAHNDDGTLKKAAVEAVGAASSAIAFTPTGTVGASNVQEAVAEVATDAAAALASHAADTTQHGAGIELAVAQKSDTSQSFTSTTHTAVTGLSITVTVPSRPFVVKVNAAGLIAQADKYGRVDLYANGVRVPGPVAAFNVSAANEVGQLSNEWRIPNAFHNPTAGSTVTYEARASTDATSFTIVAGTYIDGLNYVASITALTQ